MVCDPSLLRPQRRPADSTGDPSATRDWHAQAAFLLEQPHRLHGERVGGLSPKGVDDVVDEPGGVRQLVAAAGRCRRVAGRRQGADLCVHLAAVAIVGDGSRALPRGHHLLVLVLHPVDDLRQVGAGPAAGLLRSWPHMGLQGPRRPDHLPVGNPAAPSTVVVE